MKVYENLDILTCEHKGYTIKVYQQQQSPEWQKNWENGELRGDELGTHAYKIYNAQGECVGIDRTCMGDEGACIENAKSDIDVGDIKPFEEGKEHIIKSYI